MTVGVSVYVLAINDVSDKNMDFTLDMYFRQFWHDPRLTFEKGATKNNIIVFGSEKIEEIWKPDTFFSNEKPSIYKGPDTDTN